MSEWDNVPVSVPMRELTNTITLTKKEVEEARGAKVILARKDISLFDCFWEYRDYCEPVDAQPCLLCKKLTQFGEGGEDG